jgi:hypothetical protein
VQIVRTKRYLKDLKRLGATTAEADAIELTIASNPGAGDVIPGLSGLRKLRFALGRKGKSGGGRAIYFQMIADDVAILLLAYAKNEQSDLTHDQRRALLAILKDFEDGR